MPHPAGMDAASARYAFVDVETTGFSPGTCAVVEVACLIVDGGKVLTTFETLVNPQQPIPGYATAVHGITDTDVVHKPTLRTVAPRLESICDAAIIVAHNAPFDLGFLPFLKAFPSLCSYRFAARVVPEAPNHRNQTLKNFFNVRDPMLDGRDAHRALADAIVTRHVFFSCLERYLRAGLRNDVASVLAFSRRRTQLCHYVLDQHRVVTLPPSPQAARYNGTLRPCHAELVEAPRPSWRFGRATPPKPIAVSQRLAASERN